MPRPLDSLWIDRVPLLSSRLIDSLRLVIVPGDPQPQVALNQVQGSTVFRLFYDARFTIDEGGPFQLEYNESNQKLSFIAFSVGASDQCTHLLFQPVEASSWAALDRQRATFPLVVSSFLRELEEAGLLRDRRPTPPECWVTPFTADAALLSSRALLSLGMETPEMSDAGIQLASAHICD